MYSSHENVWLFFMCVYFLLIEYSQFGACYSCTHMSINLWSLYFVLQFFFLSVTFCKIIYRVCLSPNLKLDSVHSVQVIMQQWPGRLRRLIFSYTDKFTTEYKTPIYFIWQGDTLNVVVESYEIKDQFIKIWDIYI